MRSRRSGLWALFAIYLFPMEACYGFETRLWVDGLFSYSLSQFSSETNGDDFDAENNASFVGLTGAVEESGIEAFVIYQRGLDRFNLASQGSESEDFVREFYGGIRSVVGTITFGRRSTFYKLAGRQLDPFYDTSIQGFAGQFATEGGGYGLSNLSNGFVSNTVTYETPEWNGLLIHASAHINDNGEAQGNDENDFGIGFSYENVSKGFAFGAEYLDGGGDDVVFGVGKGVPYTATRVYGGLKIQDLSVGVSVEYVDVEDEASQRQYAMVSGAYRVLPRLTIAMSGGQLSEVKPDIVNNPAGFDGEGFSIGAFYDVISRLTIYLAARKVELESGEETESIALGASFEFGLEVQ